MEIYSAVTFFKHCSNSKQGSGRSNYTYIYALYYLGFNTSHSNYDGLIQYKLVTSLKLESHKNFTVIQVNYCTQRCKY